MLGSQVMPIEEANAAMSSKIQLRAPTAMMTQMTPIQPHSRHLMAQSHCAEVPTHSIVTMQQKPSTLSAAMMLTSGPWSSRKSRMATMA